MVIPVPTVQATMADRGISEATCIRMSARLTHLPSLPLFIDSGKIYATRIQGRNTFSVGHIVKWLDMPHKISKNVLITNQTILLHPIFFLYVLNKMSFILNRNDKITQNILFGKCFRERTKSHSKHM